MSEFKFGAFLEYERSVPGEILIAIQEHPEMRITHIMGNCVGIVTLVFHGKDKKEVEAFLGLHKENSFSAATNAWVD